MVDAHLEERARRRLGGVLRGKYRLDKVLGMGGMAVVYKATHRNRAEFAIKVLHPELSQNSDICARFLREGYAANSVKHPGVVLAVDDDVAEDGSAFLVMELLDGAGCDALLERDGGRLPLDVACTIGCELLDVLAEAHESGIVHRDVKPANLFVTRQGTLKVLDFGIARVRDTMSTDANLTGSGVLLGTPAFMSPEQARGLQAEVDARADLWAAGATVFTLATGRMVQDADTLQELLLKVMTVAPRSLGHVMPEAPLPIVQVIDGALAFEKDRRWPSARAMRDALLAAMQASFGPRDARALLAALVAAPSGSRTSSAGASLPAASPPVAAAHTADGVASSHRRTQDARQRRSLPLAIGLGAVAVAAAAGGGWVWHHAGAARAPEDARIAPSAPAVAPPPSAPALEVLAGPASGPHAAESPVASVVAVPAPAPSAHPEPTRYAKPAGHPLPAAVPKPSAATPNCDPPFYFDSAGDRLYKKECL